MTENYDDIPDQNPNSELFDNYAVFGDDVLFLDMIDQITENETKSRNDGLGELIYHIEEQLHDNDWIGSSVKVSGKLRISSMADDDVSFAQLGNDAKAMKVGKDERGYFLLANDLPMNLGIPDLDNYAMTFYDADDPLEIIEPPRESRVVFTLHSPADIVEAEDKGFEHYTYYESGNYVIYPEDVIQVKFSRPSLDMVEYTLEADYPKLADALGLGNLPPRNDHSLLERLRNAKIPKNSKLPPSIRLGIGRLLYKQLEFDADIDYQLDLNGVISSVADSVGKTKVEPKGARMYGKIVSIDLVLDGDYWRPRLIVAEPTSTGSGFEGRLVPAASIEKIVNMRPHRKRFGKLAVLNFDDPSDLYDHWLKIQEVDLERETHGIGSASDAVTKYAEDVDGLVETYFDESRDCIVQPLTSETAELLKIYNDHRRALDDDGRMPRSSDALNQLLEEGLADVSDLNREDSIEISGGLEVLHVTKTNTEPYKIEDGIVLSGKFNGVVEAIFPSKASAKWPTTPYLSFVLIDSFVSDGDADYDMFKDGVVLVKISSVRRPSVAKILQGPPTSTVASD